NQSRSLPLYAIVDSDALVGREWHGVLTPSWPSVGSLGELPLSISVFDHDVSALDVTEITQSLTKGLGQVGATGQAARQVAYSSHLRRRLRTDHERAGGGGKAEEEGGPQLHQGATLPMARTLRRAGERGQGREALRPARRSGRSPRPVSIAGPLQRRLA